MRRPNLITTLLAGLLLAGSLTPTLGQDMDFRIETDVMLPTETKPVQQTLTLFRAGVAYDFSRELPHQIMVVDHAHERLTLIDSQRSIQTIVDLSGLYALMDSARNQAAVSGLSIFLEDAQTVSFDETAGVVRVGAKVLKYEASLQRPPSAEMAQHFANFANASAYVNAWQKNSPPPFARVNLNAEVQARQSIPQEITRTTQALDGGPDAGQQIVKCRLHPNWRLSKDDHAKIEQIDGMLANFEVVPTAQFFHEPERQAAASSGIPVGR